MFCIDFSLVRKTGLLIFLEGVIAFFWTSSAVAQKYISEEYSVAKLNDLSVLNVARTSLYAEYADASCPSDGYVSDYLSVVIGPSEGEQAINAQTDDQWVDILDDVLLCGGEAIPLLMQRLDDDSPQVRYLAIYALGNFEGLADSAIDISHRLARLLSDSSESDGNRAAAAYAIGQLDSADQVTESALVNVLKDTAIKNVALRENAVLALGQIRAQSQSRFLVGLLEDIDEHDSVRSGAASALAQLHVRDAFIADMVPVLLAEETPDLVRSNVAYALRQLNINQPETLHALVSAIRSDDESVRAAALYSLGDLTTNHPRVLSSVNDLSKDADSNIRLNGVRLLGQLSDFQSDALLGLVNALDDSDFRVRGVAAIELGEAGQSESVIIRKLLDTLATEENIDVRIALVYSLGILGQDSEYMSGISRNIIDIIHQHNLEDNCSESTDCSDLKLIAVDALGNLLSTNNASVHDQGSFLPQEPLVLLERILEDIDSPNIAIRVQAAVSLGKIASPSSIRVLTKTLSAVDADWLVKASVAEALGLIRIVPEETLQGLIAILLDDTENIRTRISVANALVRIADAPPSITSTSARNALDEFSEIVVDLKKQARQAEFLDDDRAGAREVIQAIRDFFAGRRNRE